MIQTDHRVHVIDGHQIFFREAGNPANPTVLLLHGAPSSSHMFRDLIPLLADRYHLIAPDYLGFGYSDSPTTEEFDYTFDALTAQVQSLLTDLDVTRYAIYVQDYGAPVGWRLALANPGHIWAIITQNGNAYTEGFAGPFWESLWKYSEAPTAGNETPMRAALTLDAFKWQYLHGVPNVETVSPDAWLHAYTRLQRPGNAEVQLRLFRDYPSNVKLYPAVQEYFRATQVPLLAIWGRNDEIFGPAGARAFQRDLPEAEVHLLDGGHWLLESHLDSATGYIRGFLAQLPTN